MEKYRKINSHSIYWYLGYGLFDNLYSYYHLNIRKRPQYWKDASSEDCLRIWCRYCGKGKNKV